MTSENTFILKFLLVLTLMYSYRAYQEIKVYRLIQYQQEEKLIGSQYTSLNYVGSHYKGDLLRKIVVLKLIEMSSLEELKSYINSNCNAVLIILSKPERMTAKLLDLLNQIQMFLIQETFFIPIYFSYESDELNEIYDELKAEIEKKPSTENLGVLGNFVLENLTQFNLNSNDGKKHESIQLENLYGYLEGNNSNGSNNPIIMIVANYDNLSIIPDLPSGLNKNASGVIVLLEIMRIMSKLYENYSNLINYDLLFLLSSGGSLNYQGSNHFINNLDSNTIENIHFTLCLDSLGQSDDEINLHLSRFPKQEDEVGFKFQKVRYINIRL